VRGGPHRLHAAEKLSIGKVPSPIPIHAFGCKQRPAPPLRTLCKVQAEGRCFVASQQGRIFLSSNVWTNIGDLMKVTVATLRGGHDARKAMRLTGLRSPKNGIDIYWQELRRSQDRCD
jgi:hypothetical protein